MFFQGKPLWRIKKQLPHLLLVHSHCVGEDWVGRETDTSAIGEQRGHIAMSLVQPSTEPANCPCGKWCEEVEGRKQLHPPRVLRYAERSKCKTRKGNKTRGVILLPTRRGIQPGGSRNKNELKWFRWGDSGWQEGPHHSTTWALESTQENHGGRSRREVLSTCLPCFK